MQIYKKLCLISLLLLIAATLTGCWNRTELNEIGLISALGVDKNESGWTVSYQLVNPSAIPSSAGGGGGGGGGSQAPVHVFSSNGMTIREAIDVSFTESPRRLYFPHADILVLGKEAAEKGITEIIDFYWRNTQLRENVSVLVTKGKASDMLKQLVPPERLPGTAIANILRQTDQFNSYFPSIKMYELTRDLGSEAEAAVVPEIELSGMPQAKIESMDQLNKTFTPAKVRITGLSVFQKDRRIGTLTPDESFGISLLTDKVSIATLSLPCPGTGKKTENISFQIMTSKTRVKPRKEADAFTMVVSVNLKGRVTESTCPYNLANLKNLHAAEKVIESTVKDYLLKGWEASKRLHADLPHFAEYIHSKYPQEWKKIKDQWGKEELQSTQLVVQVKASISQTGMSQKTFKPGED